MAVGGFTNNFPRSFAFRLTLADGERLDAAAAAAGTTPGEWAREAISTALGIAYRRRSMRRGIANAELLRSLIGELGRQGGNLNQVARRLNADPSIDATSVRGEIEAIRVEQAKLVAEITAVIKGTARP